MTSATENTHAPEAAGQTIDAGGIVTHYWDQGSGDPVLMLHGSGPGVSAWANWQHNMAALAQQGNRVLAPDLVGFGYTRRPDDVYYSLDTWRDHVWSFLDALGLHRVRIVGNSLGGRIALAMAAQHPERVERMVLMGAPGVGMTLTDGLRALRAYQPSEQNMREMLLDCFAVDPSIITDELVRTRYRASVEPGAFEAYTEMFSERHGGGQLGITEEQTAAIDTRTLLLHGREDKVVPVEVAWNMVRLLPDADLTVFARCGHWTQIERAADFNTVVGQFLGEQVMTLTDVPAGFPLVDEDAEQHRFRVHRSSMTSQQTFEQERNRIFDRCWLYVGHESEVSKPGDFVRRSVGGRPLFMVRGAKSNQVKVFLNSCTHRGAMICRQKEGNSKSFPCFYHAWSFDSEGDLKGVPDRAGYGDKLDFAQLGLKSPVKVDSYRGFVFASFDPDIVDLVSYLAGAREYLDLVIDSADGEMEIVRGTNEYCMAANWKLLCENSIDGYHAVSVHDTYFKYLVALGTDLQGGVKGTSRDLGNGHTVLEYSAPWGRPIAKWEPLFGEHAREEIATLRAGLVDRYGEERASRMADTNRNMLIYPNLVVNDIMAVTVRTFMPSAPGQMDITAWELAPRGELPQLRQRRLDSYLTFLGPAGFATPDDVEALESCQQGFSTGVEWSDISRGMAREQQGNDEGQMRVFWRRWAEQMGDAAFQEPAR